MGNTQPTDRNCCVSCQRTTKIAIAVFIEIATGDRYAAKIASLMIEKTFER
jgi:hypothetical protein